MLKRFAIAILLAGAATAALASKDHRDVRELVRSGEIMPLQQLLQRHAELGSARILEIELERKRGGYIYEIELLNEQGRVEELEIDAVDGQILRRKLDD